MSMRWQTLCALALFVLVALSHQALAVARGQGGAAQAVVICAGQGTYVLHLDANGDPVAPAHLCPDAVVAPGLLTVSQLAGQPTNGRWNSVGYVELNAAVPRALHSHAQARGPPLG